MDFGKMIKNFSTDKLVNSYLDNDDIPNAGGFSDNVSEKN